MAQVTIYLPPQLEKKVRASARRARKSLSAYIAARLDEEQKDGLGWPKGYVEMLLTWANVEALHLKEDPDPVPDFRDAAKAFD